MSSLYPPQILVLPLRLQNRLPLPLQSVDLEVTLVIHTVSKTRLLFMFSTRLFLSLAFPFPATGLVHFTIYIPYQLCTSSLAVWVGRSLLKSCSNSTTPFSLLLDHFDSFRLALVNLSCWSSQVARHCPIGGQYVLQGRISTTSSAYTPISGGFARCRRIQWNRHQFKLVGLWAWAREWEW